MRRARSVVAAFVLATLTLVPAGSSAAGTVEERAAISRLYDAAFQRPPDADGLRYWEDIRAAGLDLNEIADYFASSLEFQLTYGDLDDAAFVERVYLNVLDREPDIDGLDYWVGLLTQHTRGTILNGFAQSPEFIALTADGFPREVLMIGDSIFHGVRLLSIPVGSANLTFMTEEGRQASALPDLLDQAAANGSLELADAIVIHLGTNGWRSEYDAMFDAELQGLADRPVLLVNTEVDRPWESAANTSLRAIADRHDHVSLLDWNAEVAPHPDWMRADGVHPTPAGLSALAALIERELYARFG